MSKYFFSRDGIFFKIEIFLNENNISIQGTTNINNIIYYLSLSLKDLHNKDKFFQRSNSLKEAYDIFLNAFNQSNVFIKEINNSGIIIGIKEKEDILFLLKSNLNNNNIGNNQNGSVNTISKIYSVINNMNKKIDNNTNLDYFPNNSIQSNNSNFIPVNIINYTKGMINNIYNNSNNNNYTGNIMLDDSYPNNNLSYNKMSFSHNDSQFMNNSINYPINTIYNENSFNNEDNEDSNNYNRKKINIKSSITKSKNNRYNNIGNNNSNHNDIFVNSDIRNNIYKIVPKINSKINNNQYPNDENDEINYNNNNKDNKKISEDIHKNNSLGETGESSIINIRILQHGNNYASKIEDLSGLLKLLLIKKLSDVFENIYNIEGKLENDLKNIFQTFGNKVHLIEEPNIELLINENKIVNIYFYSQFLQKIKSKDIFQLIKQYLNKQQKLEIDNYWKSISKYKSFNTFFESQFINDLKKSKFDYSLISINILERENSKEYAQNQKICPNINKKILYFNIKTNGGFNSLEYSKKTFYGKGFYFTDNLDYLSIYLPYEKGDFNYGKIIPINSSFTCIASEIFYDKNKLKFAKDINLFMSKSINDVLYLQDEKPGPNGIHYIKIENKNKIDSAKSISQDKEEKKNFIGNEYVISEKYQIFPIYALTLKRNEYCVLWKDPHFSRKNNINNIIIDNNDYSTFLEKLKEEYMHKTNMNFYFESSMEEALKFIIRRKYDKIILVTNIGLDLSGKKFIEIARKILGFDIIVLFFSNNPSHFEWISNFPNCLYTNKLDIFEEYILNYNEDGLKKLREKVVETYQIKLKKFSFDFISFPNYKSEGEFSSLEFKSNYIRRVYIKNDNIYLCMNDFGEVHIGEKPCEWDITIYDNEITLFSNGFYLDIDDHNKVNTFGNQYLSRWNFDKINDYYYFISSKKKMSNILTIEGKEVFVKKDKPEKSEIFELIDVLED